MNLHNDDIIDIEIESGTTHRSFINKMLGGGDSKANRYGMRVLKDGQAISLSGCSCVGYFIRKDGNTLVINGTVNGSIAYVELPAAAYAIEGNFSLAIKISGTGFSGTVRIVDGTVVKTTTGTILDPASEIPSLEDLMEVIERAENAADEIGSLNISTSLIRGTRYKISVTVST